MGFKNLPYWLKGGIIGSLIFLGIFVLVFLLGKFTQGVTTPFLTGLIFFIFLILIAIPGALILLTIQFIGDILGYYYIVGNLEEWKMWQSIVPIITYFLLGALIGWMVGKIKSKKR